jgi:hypothetical protein
VDVRSREVREGVVSLSSAAGMGFLAGRTMTDIYIYAVLLLFLMIGAS